MTSTKGLRVLTVVLGLALLLPAWLTPSNSPKPIAILANDPPVPSEPTFKEGPNTRARETFDREPWHYQCRDYPSRRKLQPKDLVPTGNVSAHMKYDNRTGRYETVSVDSAHITVSYEESRRAYPGLTGPVVRDVYRWTYARGVQHYGTFVLHRSPRGEVQWARVFATHKNGIYEFDDLVRDRHDRTPEFVIIATDTTSCRTGNPVPGDLWRDATENGLNYGADQ